MRRVLPWLDASLAVLYAITAALYYLEGRTTLAVVWTFSTVLMAASSAMLFATRE